MKSMKTLAILLFLYLANSLCVYPAFIENVPRTFTQPDGNVVHYFATGDEFYHWLHDENNYTIVKDSRTGYLVYAVKDGGKLIPSQFIVGRDNPAEQGLQKGVNIAALEIENRRAKFYKNMETQKKLHNVKNVQTSGTINNLAVFIRFADQPDFPDPATAYDEMFNSAGAGVNSLHNYFTETTYNQVTINSTFYPEPAGTTVISYQDYNPRSYYEKFDSLTNLDGYIDDNDRTYREHSLLLLAVDYVSSQVPTSLNLDFNQDGYVDNVCFIVKGDVDDWADLLWPHRWALYTQNVYINGLQVWDYNFQLESFFFLPTRGVGVLCHEMFHTLGAPDLYHYNLDFRNFRAVGPWDLMDRTKNPGQSMCAYMKYLYGNWITEIPEITTAGTYTLNPLTSPSNNCFKIGSPNSTTEYFVLEYRQRSGVFESSLPGEGLLIYRINSAVEGYGNSQYPDYPDEVYLYRPGGTDTITADIDSAAFSLNSVRTEFSNATNPWCFLSDGTDGGLHISDVTTTGSTISFYYHGPNDVSQPAFQRGSISCYPNPAANNITLALPQNPGKTTVKIYDVCNRMVLCETFTGVATAHINIKNLNKGIYIVDASSESECYKTKFVKK